MSNSLSSSFIAEKQLHFFEWFHFTTNLSVSEHSMLCLKYDMKRLEIHWNI